MTRGMLVSFFVLSLTHAVIAGQAEPLKGLATLPIREVTIFKDGHVFVLHSGRMPVNESGKVVMDYLPAPVLGTYWPYSADPKATLQAVRAGKRKVTVEKTALTIREMIEANIGANVMITERPTSPNAEAAPNFYKAIILKVPVRSSEELEALNPSSSDERLPEKGKMVLLKTGLGVKAVSFARIMDVTFTGQHQAKVASEEFRNLLTLDLAWSGAPKRDAEVGMIYLQRGLRWIPSYQIEIDGKGRAVVKLEGTLINELTDIRDVTAHLVIGVPSFAFKDSVDPISLRQDVARLSSNLRPGSQTGYGFSNAIMTQQMAAPRQNRGRDASTLNLGPSLEGGQKNEDLYMFTVKHITLRKGERLVMPIAELVLRYEDVYALDIPFSPPAEVMRNLNTSQRRALMAMHAGPKVKHKIRLTNTGKDPFTTAPAMILKNGRLIAQGLMTYTPVGGKVDVELTTAVDIQIKKTDRELKRIPNAVTWNGDRYSRIDLEGIITLTNFKQSLVRIEVTRYVLGNLDTVGEKGEKEMINPFENSAFLPDSRTASWWTTYSWPWWWHRFNGIGKATWTTTLGPSQSADHSYTWHYLWR